jgi:transcriptional regulator with XRE-family HTH domain
VPLDPTPDWVTARRREIGDRLRTARLNANLTQEQLGERVGRDRRTIHRWEYAQRIPDLEDLLLLADALDVPLADLVRWPAAGPGG